MSRALYGARITVFYNWFLCVQARCVHGLSVCGWCLSVCAWCECVYGVWVCVCAWCVSVWRILCASLISLSVLLTLSYWPLGHGNELGIALTSKSTKPDVFLLVKPAKIKIKQYFATKIAVFEINTIVFYICNLRMMNFWIMQIYFRNFNCIPHIGSGTINFFSRKICFWCIFYM